MMMRALVVVDVQNDFLPGGPLPAPAADEVVPVINRLMPAFVLVVAAQDWHPRDHGSFAANHPGRKPGDVIDLDGLPQILWPVHCVQETPGAAFAPGLNVQRFERVFRKGTNPRVDSYGAFFDNGRRQDTGLCDFLRQHGVDQIFVAGLTTDYCVKCTALDARSLGFRTTVVLDGCRGVNVQPGDVDRAIKEMKAAGVGIMDSAAVLG